MKLDELTVDQINGLTDEQVDQLLEEIKKRLAELKQRSDERLAILESMSANNG